MKTLFKLLLLLLVIASPMASCREEDDNEIEAVNKQMYYYMKEIYLWSDQVPDDVDPGAYNDPQEFLDELRYQLYDKWSYVETKDEYNNYSQGKMVGHGIGIGMDSSENIRIIYVFKGTQAANLGVKRGWIISKVNGTFANYENVFDLLGAFEAGITNNIVFINENGASVELSLTKHELDIKTVLHYEVINQGATKIGYMVFEEFIRPAYTEFEEVFGYFNSQGIDELIVDLRYNPGGYVTVADTLAGWLIGKNHGGEVFTKFHYNDKYYRQFDKTFDLPNMANGMSLDRIFFIGTSGTASASELVINGVAPYVESILVGSNTHGKPVGMDGFEVGDYMMWPITFHYYNADNEGEFFEGLPPDLPADDDITKNFGDPEEASLKAALDYIGGNVMKSEIARSAKYPSRLIVPKKPFYHYLNAF